MPEGERGGVKNRVRRRNRPHGSHQRPARDPSDGRLGWQAWRDRGDATGRRLRAGYATHRALLRRVALRTTMATMAIAVALGWLLWGSDYTRVAQVDVHILDPRTPSVGRPLGDDTVRARTAQIIGSIDVPLGKPLVDVDIAAVSRRVEDLSRYSKVTVERGWPNRVDVTVTPRVAVLAVADGGPAVQLLDGDGLAFERADEAPAGVPTVTLSGDRRASGRAAAGALLALPGERREQVREISVDAQSTVELQVAEVRVQWGGAGDERLKAAVVDALVDAPGIERLDVSVPQRPVTTGGH